MDSRFKTVWDEFERRRDRGEPFDAILDRATVAELVAALAGAAKVDAVAANAIATALLNRERRAPFLGAFLVSFTTVVMIYVLDFAFTGTLLFLDSGLRAYLLVAFSGAVGLFSLCSWMLWRGRWGALRGRLSRHKRAF